VARADRDGAFLRTKPRKMPKSTNTERIRGLVRENDPSAGDE